MKISLQLKIFISFLVLNVFVFSILIILSVNLLQKNNGEFIKYDLLKTQQDARTFVAQFIKTNKIGLSKTIDEEKEDLLAGLDADLGVRGAFYALDGSTILCSSSATDIFYNCKNDLVPAIKGKASYSIIEKEGMVVFSMPVIAGGKILWVYRLVKDYKRVFDSSNNLSQIIMTFGVASIILIHIASLLISKTITRPIKKLKEITNKIALKDYTVDIDIKSSDEIGDLAHNFKVMQKRITEHIGTIERDKDLLNELLTQRKRFFDSVTHELKTPLGNIQGYTQMIAQNGFEDKDFFEKGTTHIIEESIRLHKLVLSLLEISELNSGHIKAQFEVLDISSILAEVCDYMEIKARQNGISIETAIVPQLTIKGSCEDIKGLFINLIDNAVKYAGEKSLIKVITEVKVDNIEIIVKDNGVGIPKDKLAKIFEPFYRVDTKKSRKLGSSGLGLSIAKNIVKVHGGNIYIESSENTGTKVTIKLPKRQE